MSVQLEILLELDKAEEAANKWQEEFVKQVKEAADRGDAEFAKFKDANEKQLDALSKSAYKEHQKQLASAEKAISDELQLRKDAEKEVEDLLKKETEANAKALEKQKKDAADAVKARAAKFEKAMNDIKGGLGDVNDFLQMGAGKMLGLSDSTLKAADSTLSFAEKGASLLSFAGPWGIAIGGVAGAVVGYFNAEKEAEALMARKMWEKRAEEIRQFADKSKAAIFDYLETAKLYIELGQEADKIDMASPFAKKQRLTVKQEYELAKRMYESYKDLHKKGLLDTKEKLDEYKFIQEEYKKAEANYYEASKSAASDYYDAMSQAYIKFLQKQRAERDKEKLYWDQVAKHQIEMYDADIKATIDYGNEKVDVINRILQAQFDAKKANADADKTLDQKRIAEQEAAFKEMEALQANIAGMFANTIGTLITDSFNNYWETLATGEKKTDQAFKKMAASMARNLGSQLISDGTKNLLVGAGRALTSWGTDPTATGLISLGGAEIATGAAMGGIGARAQRRQGYGKESEKEAQGPSGGSLGRSSNSAQGTTVQAPTIVNLGLLALTDQRHMEQAGRQIGQAVTAFKQGRP